MFLTLTLGLSCDKEKDPSVKDPSVKELDVIGSYEVSSVTEISSDIEKPLSEPLGTISVKSNATSGKYTLSIEELRVSKTDPILMFSVPVETGEKSTTSVSFSPIENQVIDVKVKYGGTSSNFTTDRTLRNAPLAILNKKASLTLTSATIEKTDTKRHLMLTIHISIDNLAHTYKIESKEK